MYPQSLLALFAIPVLSAAVQQDFQRFLSDPPDQIVHAAWKSENKLTIVPLIEPARQGVVPASVEEGLIAGGMPFPLSSYSQLCLLLSIAGPRFANELLANITQDGELGSCWSCVNTIIKESPCIYKAIREQKLSDLLQCGVGKADV
jgi:hypothetical protein